MDIHGFSPSLNDLSTFGPSLVFMRLSDPSKVTFAQRQETTPKTLAISTGDMGGFKVTEKHGESR